VCVDALDGGAEGAEQSHTVVVGRNRDTLRAICSAGIDSAFAAVGASANQTKVHDDGDEYEDELGGGQMASRSSCQVSVDDQRQRQQQKSYNGNDEVVVNAREEVTEQPQQNDGDTGKGYSQQRE
jgi:hypothetical protein